jgi:hypothetical protein
MGDAPVMPGLYGEMQSKIQRLGTPFAPIDSSPAEWPKGVVNTNGEMS